MKEEGEDVGTTIVVKLGKYLKFILNPCGILYELSQAYMRKNKNIHTYMKQF